MDETTVPTPPEPRQSHAERYVEPIIAAAALASMAVAILVDPAALIVTSAAVVAQIVWAWTR